MLGKIVLGLVVVAVALFMLRRVLGPSKSDEAPGPSGSPRPPSGPKSRSGTRLRACEVCGAHVPESEALLRGPRAYCSADHARQGEDE